MSRRMAGYGSSGRGMGDWGTGGSGTECPKTILKLDGDVNGGPTALESGDVVMTVSVKDYSHKHSIEDIADLQDILDSNNTHPASAIEMANGNTLETEIALIKSSGGGSEGEANTASNVGSGEGLVLPKTGVNLPFKSLKVSGNATIESDEESITINVQGGGGGGQLSEEDVKGIVEDTLGGSNPLAGLDMSQDATGAGAGYRLFGDLGTGKYKWAGGVLAPNDKIYGIPRNSTQVLEIDPVTGSTTLFGELIGSNKWDGGVLAPNGKIYGIPSTSTQVLEIDPEARTTTLFGELIGDAMWRGGVLAPNGKIYGIPSYNATQVLEIDPVSKTTTLFGELGTYGLPCVGGVLAPNGKIYGIPRNSTQILEIDPVTRTTTLFGDLPSGSNRWDGGVLAPNGKIYGIPHDAGPVLEIDPETQTTTLFGSLPSGYAYTAKWVGGVLAPNGKIYGIPHHSGRVSEIDPVTKTTTQFGSLLKAPAGGGGVFKWHGGVLATNGKIYGIPCNSNQVLEISKGMNGSNFWALSAYVNKY